MADDVAVDNLVGQQLLESIGFEKDQTVSGVCRMTMTGRTYMEQYGEPNKTAAGDT